MTETTPQEKREQERFTLNLQARITYRHAGEGAPVVDTVAANISSGGAFLETSHPFPMAAKVEIEFHISVNDLYRLKFILSPESLRRLTGRNLWVKATGVVIRRAPDGIAVIFDTDYQLSPLAPGRSA